MTGLPVPAADDPDTGGFFAAAQRHELALCYCSACDSVLHLPKAYCHHCGSWDVAWRAVRPAGTLHSFTIVEHQVHPAFPVPHTLVLVSIDDEPAARLVGHIPGRH
ncbi:MAG: Zn-ribbon domain-containing OB-fold protein, partial [Acidimicrobiia bacterium]